MSRNARRVSRRGSKARTGLRGWLTPARRREILGAVIVFVAVALFGLGAPPIQEVIVP